MFRGKNIQLYKNKIAQLIIDFTFDLLRIAVITPMIIFFAVIIFIIIVFIQEKINPELSVSIIKFLFGEKTHSVEFFYEGDIMIIYRRCALIFFLIVGIISHFLHKKFELNFRKKMMIAVCLIFIGYGYVFTLSLTHKGLFSASFIPMMSIITLIASFFGIGASTILNKIQKIITRKIEK
jgi:hypothetical protein